MYEIFFWVTIANDVLLRLASPCLLAYVFGDGSQTVYNLGYGFVCCHILIMLVASPCIFALILAPEPVSVTQFR